MRIKNLYSKIINAADIHFICRQINTRLKNRRMSTTTITPSTTTGANQKAIISKILVAINSSLDYSNKFL
jgi:hypothetical protein